ncbi:MAG: sensor histidine kinase, partial [Melioribacteraceae bacterium]
ARKLIEEDLKKSHAQLRSLTSHIEKIREDERAQIAREMHDELGQILTSLKMSIAFTRKEIEAGNLEMKRETLLREFHAINSTIDTAVEEVRKLITQLRPELLDKLGLLAALEWYTEEFQKSTKIKCSLEARDKSLALNADKDLAVFRIVQEAMTNIVKYAGAKSVKIFIRGEKDKLLVEILDDGKGISEEEIKGEKSFGLMGMRERAMLIGGSLEISGSPGKGTLVRLIVGL